MLGDAHGHQVDIHTCTFDSAGNHVFGIEYPFDSLSGKGSINGYPVKCISPQWLVKFHSGYELDETDYQDVKAICLRLGIDVPSVFTSFEDRDV